MNNKETLLSKIKSLYTEIFLLSLHNRINSYHSSTHTNHHNMISSTLHKLIDEVVKDVSKTEKGIKHTALKIENTELPPQKVIPNVNQSPKPSIVSMTLNGLSIYFKKRKAHEKDPAVEARLRRCVWDHVHSAHRYARTGDAITAKLHAGIASEAMKTLSHYIPEDEYNDFFNLINGQLNENTDEVSKKLEN